jgi:hypothetical protein
LLGAAIASNSPRVPEWATATSAGVGGLFTLGLLYDLARRR